MPPPSAPGSPGSLLAALVAEPDRRDRLLHTETVAARAARYGAWPEWTAPSVRAALEARGVARPWSHQTEAAELVHAGRHTVVATGTASGKSLAYLLPAVSDALDSRSARGRRGATTLYLAPTKALAHDQLAAVGRLDLGVRAVTVDGDSSRDERDWARAFGEYVLTNPDLLHRSLLPGHEHWAAFLGGLRYVVLDECHHYRGVFGAHVAHVLRRLRRLAAAYGAHPTFVLASATVAEPRQAALRLTGLDDVHAVTDDGAPRGELTVGLWEPPLEGSGDGEGGEDGGADGAASARRSATREAGEVLVELVARRCRTLAFVRSRHGVEQLALAAAPELDEREPGLGDRVAAYRGGYLPEERRMLERQLRDGELLGLAATNALELGIDISGLDAVVIAGFPGTRAALWQQLGRAGRGAEDALGLLVARDDPLDAYLVHHPEALFGGPLEAGVFDPGNRFVLGPHLAAAAQERALTEPELALFGPGARAVVDELVTDGLLRRRAGRGWFWTRPDRACDLTDLRGIGGPTTALVEQDTGRVVGTVDAGRGHASAHTGAVYLHRGETWTVTELDLDAHVAMVRAEDPGWSTMAREAVDLRIVAELEAREWGRCRLAFGEVDVVSQVVSYLRRRNPGGRLIDEVPLDLPPRTLSTRSVWWTVPDDALAEAGLDPATLPGAAHAAEHCSIGLLPLFATCDRWDIGGLSTARHPDTGLLSVFVHDGQPGGAGFAKRGYATAASWLRATRAALAACPCRDGCPSCVQSPKCGNQNHPLDKAAAGVLLDVLLAGAPRS